MNRVLLTGRLTRDPELRTTAGGKAVVTFSLATHEYAAGKERTEFHNIVAWNRLAETCGRYLGKGQQVAVEGRIQTRTWDDADSKRHWRTEIIASSVEMLAGRRRRDDNGGPAAAALEAQAIAAGIPADASEPMADDSGFSVLDGEDEEEDELLEEAVAA